MVLAAWESRTVTFRRGFERLLMKHMRSARMYETMRGAGMHGFKDPARS